MKKIGLFFKSIGKKGYSVLKSFLSILNLFVRLMWPYFCLMGVIFIPVKKGSELFAVVLYIIVYASALYGYFRISYLEKEIKYCRSCCLHVNPAELFIKFFEKTVLVEDEMSVLDAQAEIFQKEKDVWTQALELIPKDNHELQQIFRDKIDECKNSIHQLYNE